MTGELWLFIALWVGTIAAAIGIRLVARGLEEEK